jgi:RNA polymerase sigma-70 factor (ECF subfamily)
MVFRAAELDVASLYDEHVDFVWRMVSRLGVQPASVEDAVQEVFLTLHRRRAEFRGGSSVRTWIGGIAVRVARDHRRAADRHDARLTALQGPAREPGDPLQLASDAQALALVLTILESLDEDQRTAFVLVELEEMTAVEVGDIVGVSPNTVSSRLRLARKRFNELLAAHQRMEAAI